MSSPYVYEIYDTEKKEWLPGQYRKKEILEMFGVDGSVSEWAKNGTLLKKRYKIAIVGEQLTSAETFAKEWDTARMKLLRTKRN